MIPEIGHFALLLCLPIAIALAVLPLWGIHSRQTVLMRMGKLLATGQWFFLCISFICLAYAFLHDDFTVKLVASHSNSHLPAYYKFSALWGNHEGSLLLWAFILASWTLAVAFFSRQLPDEILAYVLSVLGMICIGFLCFIIFTSNPFERLIISTPADGRDLNPLLQDIGLIMHPPLLYIGYVGFSVAFAFAVAALMSGKLDAAWARWSRPWTNVAWAFLTIGIALGSWWAYYELGWGGWWFWDPVENASFMPWLAGTALIHSLAATEKRGVFHSWTVLLAILAFSLSLLGTFLVRSGILVSVHAFASDPERGMFILAFLALVVGGSLLLYALKAPTMRSSSSFTLLSRETLLLVNNILLTAALVTVLLGTLFPLVMKALDAGTYSVGAPYFNKLFLPIMIPMILVMGIAPYFQWKKNKQLNVFLKPWLIIVLLSVFVAFISSTITNTLTIGTLLTLFLFFWLLFTTLWQVISKANKSRTFFTGLKAMSLSYWGMVIAHCGIAVTALGIGLTSIHEDKRELKMQVGDSVNVLGYTYNLDNIDNFQGPNYTATIAFVSVFKNGQQVALLKPEKRFYHAAKNIMTEAGIDASLTRDLYMALGEKLSDGAWAVRVHVKPFVRCIWLGSIMMALGGFLAVIDKRYRRAAKKSSSRAATIEPTITAVQV